MALTTGRRAGETPRRRGSGGGAATTDGEGPASGPATPHKGAAAPAPVTPPTTNGSSNGSSGSPNRRRGRSTESAAAATPAAASKAGGSRGSGAARLVVVVLVVLALVAQLALPALRELKAMVMFRHGRGMTEEQVRSVVIQTIEQREKEQAAKQRGGLFGRGTKAAASVGKEEIRQAFRELMKEEGAAMVAATLPPPPAPITTLPPAAPAMDETALRKEIQSEVARQLRAFGPAGQPPSEEDRTKAAARGIVP